MCLCASGQLPNFMHELGSSAPLAHPASHVAHGPHAAWGEEASFDRTTSAHPAPSALLPSDVWCFRVRACLRVNVCTLHARQILDVGREPGH